MAPPLDDYRLQTPVNAGPAAAAQVTPSLPLSEQAPRYWPGDPRERPLTDGRAAAARGLGGAAARGWPRTRSPRSAPDEADAFLARVELALPDVHEPLAELYGARRRRRRAVRARAADRARRRGRPPGRRCAGSTGGGRSTRAGSSAPGCRATSATSTASAARSPSCPAGSTTSPSSAPPTCTSCRCCSRGRGRTTAATRSPDYRAVDPRLGTMADLEAVAGALHERGMSLCIDLVLNHTAREHRVGAGLAGRRPGVRRLLHGLPRPDDARRLRRDHPGGLPRPGAGLVQLGARGVRRRRRLGLDDVLALPVGPRLHQPRRHPGDARRDHLAGQPRRRRLPHGRRPVHVEAAGHRPARTSRRGTCCCSCCTR